MKVVVLGASSFIGLPIQQALGALGTYAHHPIEGKKVSLLEIDRFLFQEQPDVIVNCIAISNVDECEMNPDKCTEININPTKKIVSYCQKNNAHYVFLSSSAVFGEGIFYPTDKPCPLNIYGESKVVCENILKKLPRYSIIRTNLTVGLPKTFQHENLFTYIYNSLSLEKKWAGNTKITRNITCLENVVNIVKHVVERQLYGIFHVPGEVHSPYSFAQEVAKIFSFNSSFIKIDNSLRQGNSLTQGKARRPEVHILKGDEIIPQITLQQSLEHYKKLLVG